MSFRTWHALIVFRKTASILSADRMLATIIRCFSKNATQDLLRATIHLLWSSFITLSRCSTGLLAAFAFRTVLSSFVQEVLPGIIFHNKFN